jgi:hypothetical protein
MLLVLLGPRVQAPSCQECLCPHLFVMRYRPTQERVVKGCQWHGLVVFLGGASTRFHCVADRQIHFEMGEDGPTVFGSAPIGAYLWD